MKAMVFAAGRGTRLRPFTDAHPKALAPVGGVPLLEIVLCRLRDAGVTEVVINLHHFPEQIREFLARRDGLGLRIVYSEEHDLLDTGGGLKHAARLFDDPEQRGILVHNVDVLSDIDLAAVWRTHVASHALATLVAMPRSTARPLLFDAAGRLCGRVVAGAEQLARPPHGPIEPLGYCGIQVISPALFAKLTETGAFSIIDSELRLAAAGEDIRCFRADGARWRDAGRPENLRPL